MNFFRQSSIPRNILFCLTSSLILSLAYPKPDISIFAWIGLIPFLIVLDGKTPKAGFIWGLLMGAVFYGVTLYWLAIITKLGLLGLALYLALYVGFFGWIYSITSGQSKLMRLIILPCAWAGLEYLRSTLFSGFTWVTLGHSQYRVLPIIQIADITAVYGVSFLVVMVNWLIKETWFTKFFTAEEDTQNPDKRVWITALVILMVTLGYGIIKLSDTSKAPMVKVTVIQGNIPQELKWEESAWPSILRKYLQMTKQAATENPDLIVWPETSFPGFAFENQHYLREIQGIVGELKVPLLFGVIDQRGGRYYNSAYLLDQSGEIIQKYKKIHLVPFGEYIPFRKVFPFLTALAPISDFTAHDEFTTFSLNNFLFSVLICFEDTVGFLSRGFVNHGAQLLINITNDAWFLESSEPAMHLQSAMFRSIETRRSMIRAANTGISCFIHPNGRIKAFVKNEQNQKISVPGISTHEVPLMSQKTFYTRFGSVFAFLCLGLTLISLFMSRLRLRKTKQQNETPPTELKT